MSEPAATKKSHRFYGLILILLTLWMSLPGIASLQVIDRDEARYAQATVQMVESGDYLNIKFQDEARNKKPAGIYWMQAVFVKALTDPGERKIWTHRIVSVLGALLAVLATYWGAIAVLGRRGAFVSAAILATTLGFVFEAHIAKTDAMLCGLQKQDHTLTAFIFWLALGAAIMVKGPITPLIIILTLGTYIFWTRDKDWMGNLINIPGIILAVLMVVPWAIAIGMATDGAFFSDSIGGDLGSKIVSGQESHGALPGYYLTTISMFFWPGILLLIPGLVFARLAVSSRSGDEVFRKNIQLLICWTVPFWIVLELMPTKLPNYPLPLYPALSIFCGGAFLVMSSHQTFTRTRRIAAILFLIAGLILIASIFAIDGGYADKPSPVFYVFPLFVAGTFAAVIWMWQGQVSKGVLTALILTAVLTPLTYHHVFPRLDDLRLSNRLSTLIDTQGLQANRILSPNLTEPSLVYEIGTDIRLGDRAEAEISSGLILGDIILIDKKEAEERHEALYLNSLVKDQENCLAEKGQIDGTNYSKGDPVNIVIYRVENCAN